MPGTEVSLRFTDDRQVQARAGCNTMTGRASVDDGRLTVADLMTTDMACDASLMAQDEWLGDLLSGSPTAGLAGEKLTLSGGDLRLVLTERSAADPDRPLEGTTWTVESLVDGQTASSAGPEKATVEFAGGQAAVFTGCNSGSAAYRVSGDTITLEPLTLTRKACPGEIMAVESAIVAVLAGPVTYDVTSASLTLEHPSGKGLQLRAE